MENVLNNPVMEVDFSFSLVSDSLIEPYGDHDTGTCGCGGCGAVACCFKIICKK